MVEREFSVKPFKSETDRSIAAFEWRFVLIIIAVVLVLTSIPYLYAYLSAPPDKQFMGIMLDVPDHGQYFSWMRELSTSVLASNKLTPEANDPVFFNLLWWGLGNLKRWFGLSIDLTFQLFRLVAGGLLLATGYLVIARFLGELEQRRAAFLVFTFGSGFGWVLVLLKYTVTNGVLYYPLDVFIAEGNTFLGIMAFPHFIAAALYILVFILFLESLAKEQIRFAVFAGLFAQFLGWQHAYDLVLVYGILFTFVLAKAVQRRTVPLFPLKALIVIGLFSFWPALYSVLLTTFDPVWGEVLDQFGNAGVFTPNLVHLPILMGPAFLLALGGFIVERPDRLREKYDAEILLLAWFGANFLLIYIPTDYQIHLLNGWQIPIAILSTKFVYKYVLPRLRSSRSDVKLGAIILKPGVIPLLMLMLVVPTNIYLWSWRFFDLSRHDYPFYLHDDEIRALRWLEDHAAGDDVILSSLTIGHYIPAWTGARAYLAHWAQTLDFYSKRENVELVFDESTSPAVRDAILTEGSVDYLFFGPVERDLGAYSPRGADYLVETYSQGVVTIYRVDQ
ncbi:MAG: hypothetical protein MUP44_06550 [Anaerolineales bacterium]|nr:hypothetical protein [Anaerolineales bacterium]